MNVADKHQTRTEVKCSDLIPQHRNLLPRYGDRKSNEITANYVSPTFIIPDVRNGVLAVTATISPVYDNHKQSEISAK